MKPPPLGTILPNPETMDKGERVWRQIQKNKDSIGRTKLNQFEKRVIGSETRYYDGKNRYAVINDSLRVFWFEKRRDGYWYSEKA